jgi:hypothetical protein
MEFILKVPDAVCAADPNYPEFLRLMQMMLDRMAMSHYKYGIIGGENHKKADEVKSLAQRIALYDPRYVNLDKLCTCGNEGKSYHYSNCFLEKPLDTGNTENLLDAANMCILEVMLPHHPKAFFKAQDAVDSPGMAVKTGGRIV